MATIKKDLTAEKIDYIYKAFHEYFGDSLEVKGGVLPPPVNVIRAEDIQKMDIRATATIPDETKANICNIRTGVTGIMDAIGNLHDVVVRKLEPGIMKMAQPLPAPVTTEPEEKENVSIVKRVKQWLESKSCVYINLALMLATWLFFLFAGLYVTLWSDDAWARRAYDVGVRMEMDSPGDFYHETRERFNTGQRRTAKAAVLDMEEQDGNHEENNQVLEEEDKTNTNLNKDSTSWINSLIKKLQELDNKLLK